MPPVSVVPLPLRAPLAGERNVRMAHVDARPGRRIPLPGGRDARTGAGARAKGRGGRRADRRVHLCVAHRRPRRAGTRGRDRRRAAHRRTQGRDRRHERTRPLLFPPRTHRHPGGLRGPAAAVRLGSPDDQTQLPPVSPDAVDRRTRSRRRGRPRGPGRRGAGHVVDRARGWQRPRVTVRPFRADEHRRPDAVSGGHRDDVALHACPARRGRRRHGGGGPTRGGTHARRPRPRVAGPHRRASGANPGRTRRVRPEPR